jgi:hypothetical protein
VYEIKIARILRAACRRWTIVHVVSAKFSNFPHRRRFSCGLGRGIWWQDNGPWFMATTFAWSFPMWLLFMGYLKQKSTARTPIPRKNWRKTYEEKFWEFLGKNIFGWIPTYLSGIENMCMFRGIISAPLILCLSSYVCFHGAIFYWQEKLVPLGAEWCSCVRESASESCAESYHRTNILNSCFHKYLSLSNNDTTATDGINSKSVWRTA